MQRVTRKRTLARVGILIAGLGMTAGGWSKEEAVTVPAAQAGEAASAQAPATGAAIPAAQSAAASGQVVGYECVQVPVTYNQTYYRRECRTETVPVTRMVPECVNETRTITCYTPQQQIVNKPVTRYVCEPTTVTQKCYHRIPVTRVVQRTIYQTYCTTEMVNKVVTRMVPECVTETVPVTKMHKVCEPQLTTVTQKIPVTSYVPVVTCSHSCGHKCGAGGCGQCGGATVCVRYQPVTTCTYQEVQVMKPTIKFIPETRYVQRTRTKFNPVQETICVPVKKFNRVPCATVNECVTDYQTQSYDVQVVKMVRRPITETVQVCETKMIPHTSTVNVQVTKHRPVTDMVTRQTTVCVPYQVPVTVMTTQKRPVIQPVPAVQSVPASSQAATSPQAGL
jgi:hypothetical protein